MPAFAQFVALVLRHLEAYGVLMRSDLAAGRRLWLRRVVAFGILLCAALLATALACTAIIIAAWRFGGELWAVGALLTLFIFIAAGAFQSLRTLNGPAVIHTEREWAKDRQLLEELLQQLARVKS